MKLFEDKFNLYLFLFFFTLVFVIPEIFILICALNGNSSLNSPLEIMIAMISWAVMASIWLFLFYIINRHNTRVPKTPSDISKYQQYIEENKTSLGLFARPVYYNKSKIILANKYVAIEFNISNADYNLFLIDVIDKIEKIKYTLKVTSARTYKSYRSFKKILNSIIDYDTTTKDVFLTLKRANTEYEITKETEIKGNLLLDINQASEAELTALPGVTIAKAKHAIKVRNKLLFLTMNQFYEAINLDEEFIEQIQTKGKKILLNELPEYKRLQFNKDE